MAQTTTTVSVGGKSHSAMTALTMPTATLTQASTAALQAAPSAGTLKTTSVVVHQDQRVMNAQTGAQYITTIYYDSTHYESQRSFAMYMVNGVLVARDILSGVQ